MAGLGKLISGIFFIGLGVLFLILGLAFSFVFWIYATVCLIIGMFILFNEEEKIEKIKEVKKKR